MRPALRALTGVPMDVPHVPNVARLSTSGKAIIRRELGVCLARIFDQWDVNNDGKLDAWEIQHGLYVHNIVIPSEQVTRALKSIRRRRTMGGAEKKRPPERRQQEKRREAKEDEEGDSSVVSIEDFEAFISQVSVCVCA